MAEQTTNRSSGGRNPGEKKHVLLYDPEKRHISTEFGKALKELETDIEFHCYESASAHELKILPLLVTVRCTTPRCKDDLNYAIGEINKKGHSDMRNVVLIYYHVTPMSRPMITDDMKSNGYKGVRTMVEMDFNKMTLKQQFSLCNLNTLYKSIMKPINESAKKDIWSALKDMSPNYKALVYYLDPRVAVRDYIKKNLPLVQFEEIQDLESIDDENTPIVVIRQVKEVEECDIDPLKGMSCNSGKVVVFNILKIESATKKNVEGAPKGISSAGIASSAKACNETKNVDTGSNETNIQQERDSKQANKQPSNKIAKYESKDSQDTTDCVLSFKIFWSEGIPHVDTDMFSKTVDFLKTSQG